MHPRLSTIGWVYLWHFDRPLGNLANTRAQAQHYCGYCADEDGDAAELERRAAQHLAGRGAKITKAAIAQGIEISLVMAWRAPLSFEKRLKRRKDMPRLCPICCKARGRKVTRITPAEQLALPLFEEAPQVEPWPDDFEFPDPPLAARCWTEIAYEQAARRLSLPVVLAGDPNICEDIPY